MPAFTFTSPDGKKYTVNGPDGATKEQAFGILQQQIGSPAKPGAPSMLGGIVRSASEGVPLVGGMLNKMDALTNAAIAPVVNPFLSENNRLKGDTFWDRANNSLRQQEGMDEGFAREHPYVDTASRIAGAVASTGGAAMTGLGAKALGLTAKTLPGMIGQGALSGGVIGGADSAIRGGDPTEGALWGGLAGAAGPVIGAGVGQIAKPWLRAGKAAISPEIEAADQISKAFQKDAGKGIDPAEVQAAKDRGQPLALMDEGGQATQRLARRAANVSSEAQEALDATIQGRYRDQNTRTAEFVQGLSEFGDAHEISKALDDSAKRVNRPAYAKAYSAGASGIWSDELAQASQAPVVQDAIRKTMVSAKNEAAKQGFPAPQNPFRTDKEGRIFLGADSNGRQLTPSLQFWDYVKRNLDANGTRDAQEWARVVREHLDQHVPEYANARKGAAQFFGAKDALQAGRDAVTPGTEASRADNRVLRDNLNKLTDAERKLVREGAIDQLAQTLLGKRDSENILNSINQTPKAKERLALIVGPQKYAQLEAQLRVEAKMDRFRTAMGNSTTARQLNDIAEGSVIPKVKLSVRGMLEDFLTHAGQKLGRGIDERVASKVAEMLTGDGDSYQKAIKMIASNKTLMNAIRRPIEGGSSVTVRGAVTGADSGSQDARRRQRGNVTVD